ncbi:MAG: glycosyltransferase family 39 protein [Candidatus Micrarchaeota archaeon]
MKQKNYFLVAILLAQALFHLSLLSSAYFNSDENFYLSSSWLMTRGKLILLDVSDMHPPAMSFLGGALFYLFGSTLEVSRIAITILELSITFIMYVLGKKYLGERGALAAAAIYVFSEISFGGYRFLADIVLSFLASASILTIDSYLNNKRDGYSLLAGLLVGIMSIFRQSFIFHYLLLMSFLFLINERRALKLFVLSSLIPPIGMLVFYYLAGGLPQALLEIFSGGNTIGSFFVWFMHYAIPYIFLPLPALVVIYDYIKTKKVEKLPLLLFLWVAGGVLSAFPVIIYFHFLQALPPALLLGVKSTQIRFKSNLAQSLQMILIALASSLIIFSMVSSFYLVFNGGASPGAERSDKISDLVSHIQETTSPTDKIIAYQHFPIYFLAKREPSSRYVFIPDFFSNEPPDQVLSDLKQQKPKIFLYAGAPKMPEKIDAFVRENYAIEKTYYLYYHEVNNVTLYRLNK